MDKQSDLTVYEFTITKAALMGIDERERMFFVLLGFACNEIITLQKIVLAIEVFNRDTEGVEKRAYAVQGGFISRLLIAKMFEAWTKLFQQLFFNSPFRRDYEPVFSPKARGHASSGWSKDFRFGLPKYVRFWRAGERPKMATRGHGGRWSKPN